TITVADINKPIDYDLLLTTATDKPPSQPTDNVKISGSILAVRNGEIDLDHLLEYVKASPTIELKSLDIAAANAFLGKSGDLVVGGLATGKIAAEIAGMEKIAANGNLSVANATAAGKLLRGDTFRGGTLMADFK